MALVRDAWELVKHQLNNSHQKTLGEFHFRVFRCPQHEAHDAHATAMSPTVRYDKLETEIDLDLKLIR